MGAVWPPRDLAEARRRSRARLAEDRPHPGDRPRRSRQDHPARPDVDEAIADDFDALILPGGVRNPDHLRLHGNVIELIKSLRRQGKPIGAICHGPWLLVEADLLRGQTATSWPSIRTDLRNAGAKVVDEPAVTDGNIVTSRNPDDVEAFTNALIGLVEEIPEVEEIRTRSELPA